MVELKIQNEELLLVQTERETMRARYFDLYDLAPIGYFTVSEKGLILIHPVHPFSIEEVIGDSVSIFGSQAAEKGIELHTAIDPDLPAALRGDPQRMTQVINNLMGNAVKFTETGDIQLTARGRRQTEAVIELEISVQVTGSGMSAAGWD